MYIKKEGSFMRRMTKDGYWLNRHSCFLLQYHMVLVTKYRNPILINSPLRSRHSQTPKKEVKTLLKA